jgi:hypothetical protein
MQKQHLSRNSWLWPLWEILVPLKILIANLPSSRTPQMEDHISTSLAQLERQFQA